MEGLMESDFSFVNEPHPGGGAAVASSKDGVMFNDILGTTLGTESSEGYAPVEMTVFGDASPSHLPTSSPSRHLFTGKPEVDGLGYAFLFRNYRASLGKWQTADPLGYPDGWNQMAYCGNEVIDAFDLYGCHTWEERRKVEPIVGSSYEVAIKAHCTENYYNLSIDCSLERVLGSASSFVAPFDGTYNGLHVHDSEATYSNFSYTTEDNSQTVDYVGLNAKRVTRTFKLIISYSISFSYQHEVYNPDLGDFETRIEHGVKNMTSEWSIRFQCRHQIE